MAVLLNTLYVTTPKAYLRLEGETVCVMVEKEKRLQLQVPMHHLGGLLVVSIASNEVVEVFTREIRIRGRNTGFS